LYIDGDELRIGSFDNQRTAAVFSWRSRGKPPLICVDGSRHRLTLKLCLPPFENPCVQQQRLSDFTLVKLVALWLIVNRCHPGDIGLLRTLSPCTFAVRRPDSGPSCRNCLNDHGTDRIRWWEAKKSRGNEILTWTIRRERFLAEMDQAVPWETRCALIHRCRARNASIRVAAWLPGIYIVTQSKLPTGSRIPFAWPVVYRMPGAAPIPPCNKIGGCFSVDRRGLQ
jgi:hypothetical protein